jgi:hypothetical protein
VSDTGLRSPEDVLQTIGRLSPEDRRWILDHLPPDARTRLAALTTGRSPAEDATSAARTAEATATLRATSAARIVAALHAEPAWLVRSVVFASDWPWRREVLRRLPATLRLEVAGLERAGARLAPAAGEFLLRALTFRIGTEGDDAGATDSRFESLLRRFGGGGRQA